MLTLRRCLGGRFADSVVVSLLPAQYDVHLSRRRYGQWLGGILDDRHTGSGLDGPRDQPLTPVVVVHVVFGDRNELPQHPALVVRVVRRVPYEILILVFVQGCQPAFFHSHVPLSWDGVLRDVVIDHYIRHTAANIAAMHEIFIDIVMVSIDREQVAAELHDVVPCHCIRAVTSNVMKPIPK